MRDADEGQHSSPSVRDRVLLCGSCGKRRWPTVEELLRYTRLGWPRCCGEVMILSIGTTGLASRSTEATCRAGPQP